jgi:hypothetical protein
VIVSGGYIYVWVAMGIKNDLIEGISGVGKTAVAEELERRGNHVIHCDRVLGYFGDPVTGEALRKPLYQNESDNADWTYRHWIWPVDIDTPKPTLAKRPEA